MMRADGMRKGCR